MTTPETRPAQMNVQAKRGSGTAELIWRTSPEDLRATLEATEAEKGDAVTVEVPMPVDMALGLVAQLAVACLFASELERGKIAEHLSNLAHTVKTMPIPGAAHDTPTTRQ